MKIVLSVHSYAGPVRCPDVHGILLLAWDAVHRPVSHSVHATQIPTRPRLPQTRAIEKSTPIHFHTGQWSMWVMK